MVASFVELLSATSRSLSSSFLFAVYVVDGQQKRVVAVGRFIDHTAVDENRYGLASFSPRLRFRAHGKNRLWTWISIQSSFWTSTRATRCPSIPSRPTLRRRYPPISSLNLALASIFDPFTSSRAIPNARFSKSSRNIASVKSEGPPREGRLLFLTAIFLGATGLPPFYCTKSFSTSQYTICYPHFGFICKGIFRSFVIFINIDE